MERRIKTTYRFEPEQDADKGENLHTFALYRIREPEKLRAGSFSWTPDEDHELYPGERTEIAVMTREAMTSMLNDGVTWLSYIPRSAK